MLTESIAIAYIVDLRMISGFLVSLRALDKFATRPLRVYVFLPNFSRHIAHLVENSVRSSAHIDLCLLPTPYMPFEGIRKLQNSCNAYAKFIIPDLIEEKHILYLDCDTLPLMDVTQVSINNIDKEMIGAVPTQKVNFCLDKEILIKYGMKENSDYFNSGVLLINAKAWREHAISERCIRLAQELGQRAISHDQTVLNLVFYEKFFPLDNKFNHIISPKSRSKSYDIKSERILHFIGSPKPWEYLSEKITPTASQWIEQARALGHRPRRQLVPHSFAEAKNLLRLVRRTAAKSKWFLNYSD